MMTAVEQPEKLAVDGEFFMQIVIVRADKNDMNYTKKGRMRKMKKRDGGIYLKLKQVNHKLCTTLSIINAAINGG